MSHGAGAGVCRLQEASPIGDRWLNWRVGCYPVGETRWWLLPSGSLHKPRSQGWWAQISLLQVRILGPLSGPWLTSFKEYMQYQPFLFKTNNNPLIYVMSTPKWDAVRHWWVAVMVGYNFEIEYVCGSDNKVCDALSWVGRHLNKDTVKELLSHTTCYGIPWAKANDPRVLEEHDKTEGEVIMQAHMLAETKKNYWNLADSHWVVAQHGDLAIRLVNEWLKRRKDNHCTLDQYLKPHIPDAEWWIYAACQKNFMLQQNLLYLRTMPKRSNEDVPGLKHQAAIDGCHCHLGHQGRDRTLSLLRERDSGGWTWPSGWRWVSIILKSAASSRPSLRYPLWSPSFAQNLLTWCTLIICPWK